jgi:renalase
MATRGSTFGSFDHGAQYFTVRDPRFANLLETLPGSCKAWNEMVHVFDCDGRVSAAAAPSSGTHWVSCPRMNALPQQLAGPLVDQGMVCLETRVVQIAHDAANGWQLHVEGPNGSKYSKAGFDGVLLAMPAPQTLQLLAGTGDIDALKSWGLRLHQVKMAPCWTLMLSFDRGNSDASSPLWNAARSTSHDVAWVARESSKPERGRCDRWILQASHSWSDRHLDTDKLHVHKLLIQAFSEITGIVSQPAHVDSQRWRYAQTVQPLGQSHLWNSDFGIGVCGDWCLGHRVENAFVSGLELAQAAA